MKIGKGGLIELMAMYSLDTQEVRVTFQRLIDSSCRLWSLTTKPEIEHPQVKGLEIPGKTPWLSNYSRFDGLFHYLILAVSILFHHPQRAPI